ncbi:MAG: hypothetical protein KBD37_04720, partial [Burkholderiales bacterium]|nr:hypothetical protein [Burkholderiales bacterium]
TTVSQSTNSIGNSQQQSSSMQSTGTPTLTQSNSRFTPPPSPINTSSTAAQPYSTQTRTTTTSTQPAISTQTRTTTTSAQPAISTQTRTTTTSAQPAIDASSQEALSPLSEGEAPILQIIKKEVIAFNEVNKDLLTPQHKNYIETLQSPLTEYIDAQPITPRTYSGVCEEISKILCEKMCTLLFPSGFTMEAPQSLKEIVLPTIKICIKSYIQDNHGTNPNNERQLTSRQILEQHQQLSDLLLIAFLSSLGA